MAPRHGNIPVYGIQKQDEPEGEEQFGRLSSAIRYGKRKVGNVATGLRRFATAKGGRWGEMAAEKRKKVLEAASQRVGPRKDFFKRMVDKYRHGKKEGL